MGVSILTAMPDPAALRRIVEARLPRYLAELEQLVNIDCGSYTPEGVNRVADHVADALGALGATVERSRHEPGRRPAAARRPRRRPAGRRRTAALLIGHMDTVFDPGTAAQRPYRSEGRTAFGPGVTDMKAGLLAGLHAIAALQEAGERPAVTFVANPDEEIGSPFSTPVIRALAPEHDAVLVLECARANGDIVSARKGIADYHVTITGRAAHAGVEPRRGAPRSSRPRTRCSPSTRSTADGRPSPSMRASSTAARDRTSCPERCELQVDLRAATAEAFEAAAAEIERLAALADRPGRARDAVADGRPSTDGEDRCLGPARRAGGRDRRRARVLAARRRHRRRLGREHDRRSGIPTLDGLGPVGGDDHSVDEWLDLDSVVPRTTLLAALIVAHR